MIIHVQVELAIGSNAADCIVLMEVPEGANPGFFRGRRE